MHHQGFSVPKSLLDCAKAIHDKFYMERTLSCFQVILAQVELAYASKL